MIRFRPASGFGISNFTMICATKTLAPRIIVYATQIIGRHGDRTALHPSRISPAPHTSQLGQLTERGREQLYGLGLIHRGQALAHGLLTESEIAQDVHTYYRATRAPRCIESALCFYRGFRALPLGARQPGDDAIGSLPIEVVPPPDPLLKGHESAEFAVHKVV